jgi:hypothetical protein
VVCGVLCLCRVSDVDLGVYSRGLVSLMSDGEEMRRAGLYCCSTLASSSAAAPAMTCTGVRDTGRPNARIKLVVCAACGAISCQSAATRGALPRDSQAAGEQGKCHVSGLGRCPRRLPHWPVPAHSGARRRLSLSASLLLRGRSEVGWGEADAEQISEVGRSLPQPLAIDNR